MTPLPPEVAALVAEIKRLRETLVEAVAYVDEYFVEKWDLRDPIDSPLDVDALLSTPPSAPEPPAPVEDDGLARFLDNGLQYPNSLHTYRQMAGWLRELQARRGGK